MVMQGPWLNYFCCPPAGPALTVTHVQDLVNHQVTFNPATGVLNVPPPILVRRIGTGLAVPVAVDTWVTVTGLTTLDLDTTAGIGQPMAPVTPNGEIKIVKTGRYNLTIVAGTDKLTPGHAITVRGLINGSLAGAAAAPFVGAGLHVTAIQWIALHQMTAGDTLGVAVRTDEPGGIICTGAYLAAEYVEGT